MANEPQSKFPTSFVAAVAGVLFAVFAIVWFMGSSNPKTDAGYVGYLTRGAIFGQTTFVGLQDGPTSPGRGWLLRVRNASITPYSIAEPFVGDTAVLSKDNMQVAFQVHVVWRLNKEKAREFFEKYATINDHKGDTPLLHAAYSDFLKENVRTFARSEIQKYDGLTIKDKIDEISRNIQVRVVKYSEGSPFQILSVVVGNIQYPAQVAEAVALKMKTTQDLERYNTEIEIEKKKKEKRIVEAEGIAKAMEIIQAKLTNQYLQHEAIEAQKAMVGSPNHSTIYIPVGPMGVPIVGNMNLK